MLFTCVGNILEPRSVVLLSTLMLREVSLCDVSCCILEPISVTCRCVCVCVVFCLFDRLVAAGVTFLLCLVFVGFQKCELLRC